MDFRVALALIFLIIEPATCRSIPQESESLKETIVLIEKDICVALDKLPGDQLPLNSNTNCSSSIEVPGPDRVCPERQGFPDARLCPFLCHTVNLSEQTPEVTEELLNISQMIENATNGSATHYDCTLPRFKDNLHKYEFVQCLLLLLKERIHEI